MEGVVQGEMWFLLHFREEITACSVHCKERAFIDLHEWQDKAYFKYIKYAHPAQAA